MCRPYFKEFNVDRMDNHTSKKSIMCRNSLDAKSKHDGDTRFILVQALGKRIKAVRPVATCLYYDLTGMARWRVQDGYAHESFDDYNRVDG